VRRLVRRSGRLDPSLGPCVAVVALEKTHLAPIR
jgi:hypothetical protein